MKQYHLILQRIGFVLLLIIMTVPAAVIGQGTAPEIVFIGFPSEIDPDGTPNYGYLSFKDLDKDLAQVRLEAIACQAGNLTLTPGWQFDPGVQDQGSGTLQFTIAAQAPGQYTLQVILVDAMGNESAPEEIPFIAGSVAGNQPPVAAFSVSPVSGKAGEQIAFDASASSDTDGTIAEYQWICGDGADVAGQQVTHTYNSAGRYTVTLTVIDDVGDSSTTSSIIDVSSCDINIWGELSHLVEGPQTVPAGERVCFYTTWFGNTKEQVENFLDSVLCLHTIEGEALRILPEDWSEPRQVYDLELGLVWQTTWTYVTKPLRPGKHEVHACWEYTQDVFDGHDVAPTGTVYEATTEFEVVE